MYLTLSPSMSTLYKAVTVILPLLFTDVDECVIGTHTCPLNSVCNNTIGSFNCPVCKDGYEWTDSNQTACRGEGCVRNERKLFSYNCFKLFLQLQFSRIVSMT